MRRLPPTPHSTPSGCRGEYLTDYYCAVEADESATIAFFVDAMRHADPGQPVLLFAVGPTLHHVFLTAADGRGDPSRRVPAGEPPRDRALAASAMSEAHDWRPFVEYTLECEGVPDPPRTWSAIAAASGQRITALLGGDAGDADPLGGVLAPLRVGDQRLLRR